MRDEFKGHCGAISSSQYSLRVVHIDDTNGLTYSLFQSSKIRLAERADHVEVLACLLHSVALPADITRQWLGATGSEVEASTDLIVLLESGIVAVVEREYVQNGHHAD